MNILSQFEIFIVDWDTVPHTTTHIFVRKFVEDTITAQDNKIVVFIYFEGVNIRFANNYIRVAATKFKFCLRISKSSWNREPARKNSNWTNNIVSVFCITSSLFASWRYDLFSTYAWGSSCSLIHLTITCNNSFVLVWIRWLMILTQSINIFTTVCRKHSSAVSNVSNIAYFSNYQNYYGTGARSFNQLRWIIRIYLGSQADLSHEFIFSFLEPFCQSLLWVPREGFFSYHKVMKIITQKLSAEMTPMAIIHSEEWALGPSLMLSVLRLDNIQNYWNSVFIITSDKSLISIGGVGPHDTIPSQAALGGFVIGNYDPCTGLQWELSSIILFTSFYSGIFMKHLVHIKCSETLNLGMNSRLRVKFLRHIDVFLVLLKKGFQIKLTVRVGSNNRRSLRAWFQDILWLTFLWMMLEGRVWITWSARGWSWTLRRQQLAWMRCLSSWRTL